MRDGAVFKEINMYKEVGIQKFFLENVSRCNVLLAWNKKFFKLMTDAKSSGNFYTKRGTSGGRLGYVKHSCGIVVKGKTYGRNQALYESVGGGREDFRRRRSGPPDIGNVDCIFVPRGLVAVQRPERSNCVEGIRPDCSRVGGWHGRRSFGWNRSVPYTFRRPGRYADMVGRRNDFQRFHHRGRYQSDLSSYVDCENVPHRSSHPGRFERRNGEVRFRSQRVDFEVQMGNSSYIRRGR